ncbi:helix-turn-helix domain-containing protein [Herbiconiux sp. CPCC 205716]|uniref:Helix-turn-helix domain-containing protein n=1 Tax=Herbiconiux gentiana TaxID=2970912 RepID=A0ABT2GGP2_9MICO|nr:helix-turn-helix domain-containing protein [Herbiconiux gentiana]MCS5714064.1 helix-turn-helix domain-containing protein [Herbiconiux gentiana]
MPSSAGRGFVYSCCTSPRARSATITDDIGPRLRAARISRGLSLRSVATALGVSASLISQVETGKTQPSVSTLYALVNHLGISFDDLMAGSAHGSSPAPTAVPSIGAAPAVDTPAPLPPAAAPSGPTAPPLQRGTDNPVLEMENGVRWERLAASREGVVDPLLVTYEPGASSSIEGRMMRHSGVEYAYLLSGELTVKLDFDTFVLRAGDSLSFDSVRPHLYLNEGSVPAKGLWFVVGRREFSQEMAPSGQPERAGDNLASAVDVLQAMDRLA